MCIRDRTKITLTSGGNIDFGNWTINESGNGLFFAHSGSNKIKMDSSGNIDMSGDVNSNDSSIT